MSSFTTKISLDVVKYIMNVMIKLNTLRFLNLKGIKVYDATTIHF